MQPHTVFDALQLAVSPVILISACGLLLLSMSNRLGRAIDRARILSRESYTGRVTQINIIVRRARWIRSSILYIAISIFLTALLILALFMSVFLPFDVTPFIATLFIASVVCLGISLVYFMVDIFGSLAAVEADLESIRVGHPSQGGRAS